MAEAMKRLERSKREVKQAEMKIKDADEDFEDGSGTKDEVHNARAKLERAQGNVRQARLAYEAAVLSLIDIRQAGYPELRCVGAAKVDRFPDVPAVSFSDLTVMEKIGGGAFADVFKVELPVTGLCAFKQLRGDILDEVLMKEAAAMWEMRHSEHVIKLLKVCREPGKQGLLLELADGGSLGKLLHERKEKLKESDILQILHDVAAGLEFVHHRKHVHLDVKADNVLLVGKRAKLADFGTSKQACNTYRDTKIALTFQWSAPEMLTSMPKLSSACDIWSFGMLMYEVLTGYIPFEGVATHKLVHSITKGKLPKVRAGIKPELAQLMQRCWDHEPDKRPSSVELLSAIGDLMLVTCSGICLGTVMLTKGVLCIHEKWFLCFSCVADTVGSNLKSRRIRSDGGLEIGNDSNKAVFDLQSFRHLLSKELLIAWLKGQGEAIEREVRLRLEVELEREKRKWDAMSTDARIADCILFDVLPCRCPKCRERLVYEGGCFALTCGSCGARFCAFCEAIFANGTESHNHVPSCKGNLLKVHWSPDQKHAQETFARVQ
jgi:serine/threonine protein kinase